MADLATELSNLNAQATELLRRYDRAFDELENLSLQKQQEIVELVEQKLQEINQIAIENGLSEEEINALIQLAFQKFDFTTITVGNSLRLSGKSLEEILGEITPAIDGSVIWDGITLADLDALGIDISQIAGTFYSDQDLGIGWGTNDDTWRGIRIEVPNGATSILITYSGYYNTPAGGLGFLRIENEIGDALFYLSDAWTNNWEGQTLYINGEEIFAKQEVDIVNRTDTILLNGSTEIFVSMKGYTSSYPYTQRYIKELIFK